MTVDFANYTQEEKLKPEAKAAWLTALRSGRFKQGKGSLGYMWNDEGGTREERRFCCLGVLCEVAIESGLELMREQSEAGFFYGRTRHDTVLPEEVTAWAFHGDSSSDPLVNGFALSGWNDTKEADFNKIADLIEEYL